VVVKGDGVDGVRECGGWHEGLPRRGHPDTPTSQNTNQSDHAQTPPPEVWGLGVGVVVKVDGVGECGG
jgi:hypothetical protein